MVDLSKIPEALQGSGIEEDVGKIVEVNEELEQQRLKTEELAKREEELKLIIYTKTNSYQIYG